MLIGKTTLIRPVAVSIATYFHPSIPPVQLVIAVLEQPFSAVTYKISILIFLPVSYVCNEIILAPSIAVDAYSNYTAVVRFKGLGLVIFFFFFFNTIYYSVICF